MSDQPKSSYTKLHRVVALISAMLIILTVVVALIMEIIGHKYATVALGVAFTCVIFFCPVMYLVTVVPKHFAQMSDNLKKKLKEDKE